ncbi:serine hydrolase domain-containing protein [Algimonas porphyrae]|uniref:Beta-lactamase-related domain-containing protein n=1 Tax=Algimonas porphyrae TaxID=1128113 RepID=A0ABQ5V183_9PROT|nr:serine hydrolase domain-containing protein [Algimonas porphyrae]GLQ21296.1 hypothetical protein GCM10007854_22510 [Algimonas porphyrae]
MTLFKRPDLFRANSLATVALVTIASALSACTTVTDRPAQAETTLDLTEFERIFATAQTDADAPGASIAISVDGVTVWSDAFGLASVELDVAARPDTRFRIGSTSKPMTVTVLARMVERGEVAWDDTIGQYLPNLPEALKTITLAELASNRSGIRHYRDREFRDGERVWWQHFPSTESSLSLFKDDPLVSTPGDTFHYSTYGWTLLAAVLEAAAGQDFPTLLHKDVFGPLRMTDTQIDHAFLFVPNRTQFYWRAPTGQLTNAPFTENSYKWAGGGIVSTSDDLLRFANGWLDGTIVPPDLREVMWTNQTVRDGTETVYGLGWFVGYDDVISRFSDSGETVPVGLRGLSDAGIHVIEHRGGQIGGSTVLWIFPDFDIVVTGSWNMTGEGRKLYAATLQIACQTIAAQADAPEIRCSGHSE